MDTTSSGASGAAVAFATLVLAACGGGGGSAPPVTVGGTVSGLVGIGLVLADNGSDHLPVTGNGAFAFGRTIPAGSTFNVSVLAQPTNPTQACAVKNATGRAGSGNVMGIAVTCTTNSYIVSGLVSGLAGSGLVLSVNGGDALAVSANGSFKFASPIASGAAYSVSVQVQPTNPFQFCNVGGGDGEIAAAPVTDVTVICASHPISLFAGNLGGAGTADGHGSAARFYGAQAVATDRAGNIYVADTFNEIIRKLGPGGIVTTLAGTRGVFGSVDGIGAAARFDAPSGVATDTAGNVYVADTNNHTIRKITPAGVVTTFAGTAGDSGSADGTGAAARFNFPTSIAIDTTGNVYVGDAGSTIRKITPTGVVTTLAGTAGVYGGADGIGAAARFRLPYGIATDAAGNVFVGDTGNSTVRKITPAGVVTTLAGAAGISGSADGIGAAARFFNSYGVAIDAAGNVYVGDSGNSTIRKITPTGLVTTLAGAAGDVGSADGVAAAARFYYPYGIAIDAAGNLYVANFYLDNTKTYTNYSADNFRNSTIRKITPKGIVTTLAGEIAAAGSTDGIGAAALFNHPSGIATDNAGNVYVADTDNHTIRKVTPAGVVTTFAGTAGSPGSADGIGTAARFCGPIGVATDTADNVYVTDGVIYSNAMDVPFLCANTLVRKITPAGLVTTLAGTAGMQGSADGTGATASFCNPAGIATDNAGNLYVADGGLLYTAALPNPCVNSTIRKITSAGVVTTLAGTAGTQGSADGTGAAAQFYNPSGVATDAAGNIYVSDTNNHTIRMITPSGTVTTLAGTAGIYGVADGSGAAAQFGNPLDLTTDTAGNLYVADSDHSTIRKIAPGAVVTTVVGVPGQTGFAAGALPGVIGAPRGVSIMGTTLYITFYGGVAVAHDFP